MSAGIPENHGTNPKPIVITMWKRMIDQGIFGYATSLAPMAGLDPHIFGRNDQIGKLDANARPETQWRFELRVFVFGLAEQRGIALPIFFLQPFSGGEQQSNRNS